MNDMEIKELETVIGYCFKDKEKLYTALTHSSYAHEHKHENVDYNERIEFLGDAVLELVTSDFIYNTYKELPEGELTKTRASIVCEPTLAICARAFGLGKFLRLGHGEDMNGGRNRDSIISDALEALIGAIYQDGGYENAEKFIKHFVLNDIENKKLFFDSKTVLQELVQGKYKVSPEYVLVGETGPDHAKVFIFDVKINGRKIATGEGKTKKAAEQMAAFEAIKKLK